MKTLLSFAALLCITAQAWSQTHWQVADVEPMEEYENIHVQKLASDSLSSSFVIWVKEGVKSHKHAVHTENLYVIEGNGIMTVGEEEFEIEAGDYIVIPMDTFHAVTVTSRTPLKAISIQTPEFLGKDRIFAGQLKRPQEK